jgi:hypothetical protein
LWDDGTPADWEADSMAGPTSQALSTEAVLDARAATSATERREASPPPSRDGAIAVRSVWEYISKE